MGVIEDQKYQNFVIILLIHNQFNELKCQKNTCFQDSMEGKDQ